MDEFYEDNLDKVWNNFWANREVDLFHRFPGWYRAEVVETNDPLIDRRIRFRCPELHDQDVEDRLLPWASAAPWMGGKNAGAFTHPMIGDVVWICFEKQHPYGPIWCAAADPSRRKQYVLESIYGTTPAPISDVDGRPQPPPGEALSEYMPKDGRPYSTGFKDRYGTILWLNSTGYFPVEHAKEPAVVGRDALAQRDFDTSRAAPVANDPDTKYAVLQSKYGNMVLLNDVGYDWRRDGQAGEFSGDHDQDMDFERLRYQYNLRFFNEDRPADTLERARDQRRFEVRTRYGHKIELRDVGWFQTRPGEYLEEPRIIGNADERDERWMKFRSKIGHILQMIDIGSDPIRNAFIKQTLKSEVGPHDGEYGEFGNLNFPNELIPEFAFSGDKRLVRLESAHGNLLWLDDRGCDTVDPLKDTPRGVGFLLKSRRGHFIQGVDKDEINSMMFGTPGDQVFEMNDRFEYVLITTKQFSESPDVSPGTRKGYAGFSRSADRAGHPTGQSSNPLDNTYHLVLDKANCFVRLKTPEKGGIEIRDGDAPCGTWTEIRDNDNRALWFSRTDNLAIWRDGESTKYIILDDNDNSILIENRVGNVIIKTSGNISLDAGGDICMKAGGDIGFDAGGAVGIATGGVTHGFDSSGVLTNGDVFANTINGVVPRARTALIAANMGPALPPEEAGDGIDPCPVSTKIVARTEPEPFDMERGCDEFKENKGPVPRTTLNGSPGGGTGGGIPFPPGSGRPGEPPGLPPPQSPGEIPGPGSLPPGDPDPGLDPFSDILGVDGGILWYGLSSKFEEAVREGGITVQSLLNNLQEPPLDEEIDQIQFARTVEVAEGDTQAALSKERYGGSTMILRIRSVPEPGLLEVDPDNTDIFIYRGNLPFVGNIEIFEVRTDEFKGTPKFPDAV